jgi:pyrimidine-nucleoside phosphorylase
MYKPSYLIQKKRDGNKLSEDEIRFFINGFLKGEVADYQMSAMLMAIFFRGLELDETITLTDIMLNSGEKLDLSNIKGFKIDKHSTGGVGDKLSLIIAPIVATYGLYVPMISGRGLGFTGGTLDKLDSIPGFNTQLDVKEFGRIVSELGCSIIGQTKNLAPADKRIYALRDVTSTVESIPLICSSILSKKFAEDTDALVFDLKVGKGAFMKNKADGEKLGNKLIEISHAFGKKAAAILTKMDTPLGYAVGNWLEVVEVVHCLKGMNIPDIMEVTHELSAAMLTMGGVSKNLKEGIELSKKSIENGSAYRKFIDMVAAHGGDISYIENLEKYNFAKYSISVTAETDGYVNEIDAERIGLLGIDIGVGRKRVEDKIDFASGIIFRKKPGEKVSMGDELAVCYMEKEDLIKHSKEQILESFKFSYKQNETKDESLIISRIGDI